MRVNITLECTECGEQTYLTNKNKRHNPDRLELKKYCPRCRKATLHRETLIPLKKGCFLSHPDVIGVISAVIERKKHEQEKTKDDDYVNCH